MKEWENMYLMKNKGYLTAYYTDRGKRKGVNQDSMLVIQAEYQGKKVLLAVVCDGMGGLEKGEVASAEAVRSFEEWFCNGFEMLSAEEDFEDALYDSWEILLQNIHNRLMHYGQIHGIRVGTTLTAMLFWRELFYIAHVGDTRIYEVGNQVMQLTGDQILYGKNNMLLQGIGCSATLRPIYYSGEVKKNITYLLCTDGFRHKISKEEIQEIFAPRELIREDIMLGRVKYAAGLVIERGERDDITVIMVRTV